MVVSAIVTNKLVGDIDFILGMDVIRRVGGVTISSSSITFLSSKLDGCVSLQNQNKTNEKGVMNEGKAQDKSYETVGTNLSLSVTWRKPVPVCRLIRLLNLSLSELSV
ncbi:hypothetical protein GJ496_006379 [Pomphorhynchus laevis]|nr:hypothetical protein GJ496_006379 [Pomphorhynchus laevis]